MFLSLKLLVTLSIKNKKTLYFKLTLPNSCSEFKKAICVSRTPKQFLIHLHTALHACKQMGIDVDFAKPKRLLMPQNMALTL